MILVIDDPVSSFDFENKVGIMSLMDIQCDVHWRLSQHLLIKKELQKYHMMIQSYSKWAIKTILNKNSKTLQNL